MGYSSQRVFFQKRTVARMNSSCLFTVMWAFTCVCASRGCLEFEKRDWLIGVTALERIS